MVDPNGRLEREVVQYEQAHRGVSGTMILLQRRKLGLFRYWGAYFACEDRLAQLVKSLGPLDRLYAFSYSPMVAGWSRLLLKEKRKTTFVDLSKGEEAIWAGMHSSCRYKVRRAEKMRDRFEVVMNSDAAWADFRRLYNSFARAKGNLRLLTGRWIREYIGQGDVFVLYFDGRPTCGRLVLRDDENRIALMMHSATRRLEPGSDPITIGLLNRYLHWYEMKTYQTAGMQKYDFGGADDSYRTVTQFKLSFGGQISDLNCSVYTGSAALMWRTLELLRNLQRQRLRMKQVPA